MGRPSIVRQVQKRLNRMFRPGESEYQAKRADASDPYIYSYRTLKDYKNAAIRAVREIESMLGYKLQHLNQAAPYLDAYLMKKK